MVMKNKIVGSTLLAMAFFGAMSVTCVYAAVPKLMAYNGILKNGAGSYLTGTYSMTFRIYDAATTGNMLWSEIQPTVSTSSGKFSVQLGSVTALNLNFSSDYWLSVQVGTDTEMTPRVRLTSMGYSVRADYENNGFTQTQHDALSHENIAAIKENSINIAKTNFKIDSYALASANNMNDLLIDAFSDSTGVDSTLSAGQAVRVSPYYDVTVTPGGLDSNVKLLLHGNGTDVTGPITDSSSYSKPVSVSGNAQIDTAQVKFGGASMLLDGVGDYLALDSTADYAFGTGPFTIDLWFRLNNTSGNNTLMDFRPYNSNGDWIYWGITNGIIFYNVNIYNRITSTTTVAPNTWYHLAISRSGTSTKMFLNGVQEGSTYSDSTNYLVGADQKPVIGAGANDFSDTFDGWMDEIRFTKGVAQWTSNFTPQASEYTAPASTATVISQRYTQTSVPTEAMLIADETLGTGSITYSVSRNDGGSWASCTKETVTSLSGQPSGSQVKWKAVITGNAELNAVAVAV